MELPNIEAARPEAVLSLRDVAAELIRIGGTTQRRKMHVAKGLAKSSSRFHSGTRSAVDFRSVLVAFIVCTELERVQKKNCQSRSVDISEAILIVAKVENVSDMAYGRMM